MFGDINNTDFLNNVDSFLSEVYDKFDQETSKLKYYQKLVTEYMVAILDNKTIRGFIMGFETGLGKTIAAISVIDALVNYFNVYYISPKTLAANLPANVDKYIEMGLNVTPGDVLKSKIKTINISSTLVQKLGENEYNQKKGEFASVIKALGRGLVIVDEAHKLFQMIANGSKIGVEFYDIIRNSPPDVKVLFLTGSMFTSDPFECVPAFNMLSIGKTELFPTQREDFYKLFIDFNDLNMINKDYYQNRIMGFISSVKGISSLEGYPTFNETEIIKVEMTPSQYKLYDYYRDLEKKEMQNMKKTFNNDANAFGKKNSASGTFRVYTRQISNYAPPQDYFTEFVKTGQDNEEYIKQHLDEIESPKYEALKKILEKESNNFGLIYSQFTGIGGLKTTKYKLLKDGYELFNKTSPRNDGKRRFQIIDGDTKLEDVDYYLQTSSSEENKNGGIISFLLLSISGVTGLDFVNVKYKVVMEMNWSPSVDDQFNGRCRRYMSLRYLPKEEWFVNRYLLLAVVPKEFKEQHPTSTDEDVLAIEQKKRKVLGQFYEAIEEVSIECALFNKLGLHKKNCKRCLANNNRLYTDNINKDIKNTNPCIFDLDKYKKFEYEDKTYYYDGKKIYDDNKMPISIMNPIFNELAKIVTTL